MQNSWKRIFKQLLPTISIVVAAFILAALFRGAAGSDRSGYGMVVLGLTYIGAPVIAVGGGLTFVFRRTVIADWLGGACLFCATFLAALFAMN